MYDRFEQPLENRAIIDCKFDEARRVSNYETFYQFASFSFSLIFLSCIFFLFIHVISGREIVAPRRGGRAKRICEHLHNNRLVRSVAGAKQSIRNDGKGHSAIAFTIPRSPRVNLETVRDGKCIGPRKSLLFVSLFRSLRDLRLSSLFPSEFSQSRERGKIRFSSRNGGSSRPRNPCCLEFPCYLRVTSWFQHHFYFV